MSPISDCFLSGSLDRTIRLWDLRSQNCQGLMHLNGRPVASYDPEGLIFAAGIDSRQLKLYDLRTFDKVCLMDIVLCSNLTLQYQGSNLCFCTPCVICQPLNLFPHECNKKVWPVSSTPFLPFADDLILLLHLILHLQGPFTTFHVRQDYAACEWTGVKFSNDGKKILISTSIGQLKVIDAFQGHELNTLTVSE